MVKNIKRKDVDAKSKSTKFAFIITLIEAAIVDWAALAALWKAMTGAKLTSQVPYLTLTSPDARVTLRSIQCGAAIERAIVGS